MNFKEFGRYLFFLLIIASIAFMFFGAMHLVFDWAFDKWDILVTLLATFTLWPRSNIVWRRIVKLYGENIKLNGELLSTIGSLIDEQEENSESIIIFASINDQGLILYKPHLIPLLRDSAFIQWSSLTLRKIDTPKKAPEDELQDQIEELTAEIKIKGVRPKLTIPWTKELELYSNIMIHRHKKTPSIKFEPRQ